MDEELVIKSVKKYTLQKKLGNSIIIALLLSFATLLPWLALMGFDFSSDKFVFSDLAFFFVSCGLWVFLGVLLFEFLFFRIFSVCELSITNKRIIGRSTFGRQINIPVDSISSAGIGMMSTIIVSSSSGKIRFSLIKNYKEIYEKVNELLIERQSLKTNNNSSSTATATSIQNLAEELRRLKALLDDKLITQDEFDAMKKQVLSK
jgi:hypothetical protein